MNKFLEQLYSDTKTVFRYIDRLPRTMVYPLYFLVIVFVGSAMVVGIIQGVSDKNSHPVKVEHVVQNIPGPVRIHTIHRLKTVATPPKIVVRHSPDADCRHYIAQARQLFHLENEFAGKYAHYSDALSLAQEGLAMHDAPVLGQAQHFIKLRGDAATTAAVNMFELVQQMKNERGACGN